MNFVLYQIILAALELTVLFAVLQISAILYIAVFFVLSLFMYYMELQGLTVQKRMRK